MVRQWRRQERRRSSALRGWRGKRGPRQRWRDLAAAAVVRMVVVVIHVPLARMLERARAHLFFFAFPTHVYYSYSVADNRARWHHNIR